MNGVLEIESRNGALGARPARHSLRRAGTRAQGNQQHAQLGPGSGYPQSLLLRRNDRQQFLRRTCADVRPHRENIEELEVLLYDGTRMTVGWMNEAEMDRLIAQGGRVGDIYRYLKSLRERYGRLVRKDIRKFRAASPATTWTNFCLIETVGSTLPARWWEAKALW